MKIADKIVVKNYKSFDEIGGGFDQILPINVIIGKNNSGKSTLIDLIAFLTGKNDGFLNNGRNGASPVVQISTILKDDTISSIFKNNERSSQLGGRSNYLYGQRFLDKYYTYKLAGNRTKEYVEIEDDCDPPALRYIQVLTDHLKIPLDGKKLCKISAERDIVPEASNTDLNLLSNGTGATNYIQQIINRTDKDSRLIENELLKELNDIVRPDIDFTRILVQLNNNNNWEIFFEDGAKNRVALSKMGSGVKTILLVLLNLIVRPKVENTQGSLFVFTFEELENNLHPSLQRRLFQYINSYSKKKSSYFFLTTHSNVVIDIFGTNKDAQIIHVTHDGTEATTSSILSMEATKSVLSDLGVKASDLLQSNGIIWVEGPSDRNYINKWISLVNADLKEGIHYSVMFYGGRLLANLTFDHAWFDREVIPLLKINSNGFVIMDRDGNSNETKLNETKIRISNEIGDENYWITEGREIENYIHESVITKWLDEDHEITSRNKFDNKPNSKIEDNIGAIMTDIKLKYNLSKTTYSSEIIKHMNDETLEVLDLINQIKNLVQKIESWNNQ